MEGPEDSAIHYRCIPLVPHRLRMGQEYLTKYFYQFSVSFIKNT